MPLKVELGGGTRPLGDDWINVDQLAADERYRRNFDDEVRWQLPFADASVDMLYSSHCLEHVRHLLRLLHEIVRVCKVGASVEIRVPASNSTMANCCGHLQVISDEQVDHWCNSAADVWFGGCQRRLKLVSLTRMPGPWFAEVKAIGFPNLSDDQIMRFFHGTCHEVQYKFEVVVNEAAAKKTEPAKSQDNQNASSTSMETMWFEKMSAMPYPRILEVGTAGWDNRPATTSKSRIMNVNVNAVWRGLDAKSGDDVHIVADLHDLSQVNERFDAILCPYVLEHVRKPWIVAEQLLAICNSGAILFAQTHQSFPVHKYPEDYWRFTIEALAIIFRDAGWDVIDTEYAHQAKVVPLQNTFATNKGWNFEAEAWLVCEILARKP